MRSARFWQGLMIVLLTVMMVLNLRVLLNGGDSEDDTDSDVVRALKARELCDQPVIVNIKGSADVVPLNASFALQKWISLKDGQVKMIGYKRETKGFLTIGVPSIKRINGMSYLVETLSSIIDKTTTEEKMQVVVVVFLGDFDAEYNAGVVKILTDKYMDYINMGFIHIVQATRDYYPALDNLKRNFNDKPERVTWRAKQVADFAFMFLYSQNISQYYIQIEDDVICANSFVSAIREYIRSMSKNQWALLEFSELGFIGKLFRSSDLPKLARYMLMFYEEQPVDWLISYFRLSMAQRKIFLRKPTLFQHIGLKSSFDTSKDNKLKDKYFDSGEKPWKADDPPAIVISNMQPFKEWLPGLAYGSGSGFFWASNVKPGDWLVVAFNEPVKLKRVIIQTGHPKTRKDQLLSGTLEWSPKVMHMDEVKQQATCVSLQKLGTFSGGMLDVNNLDGSESPLRAYSVQCLRIVIGPEQKDWVVFHQIAVFTANQPGGNHSP